MHVWMYGREYVSIGGTYSVPYDIAAKVPIQRVEDYQSRLA